jgi:hypothetical protein
MARLKLILGSNRPQCLINDNEMKEYLSSTVLLSRMWRRDVQQKLNDVSKKRTASIFEVKG